MRCVLSTRGPGINNALFAAFTVHMAWGGSALVAAPAAHSSLISVVSQVFVIVDATGMVGKSSQDAAIEAKKALDYMKSFDAPALLPPGGADASPRKIKASQFDTRNPLNPRAAPVDRTY